MPDDIPRPAFPNQLTAPPPIDAALDLARFVQWCPFWVYPYEAGPALRGLPYSWAHYRVGMHARSQVLEHEKLSMYAAVGMTRAKEHDQDAWLAKVQAAAGL